MENNENVNGGYSIELLSNPRPFYFILISDTANGHLNGNAASPAMTNRCIFFFSLFFMNNKNYGNILLKKYIK